MSKKIRICKRVFDILHESVKAEFEQIAILEGGIPKGRGAAYYGFGNYKNTGLMASLLCPKGKENLQKYIEEQHYQSLSPKHLYNLTREFADLDPFDTVDVDAIFLNIMCKYLHYKDFDDFIERNPAISERTKDIQQKILSIGKGQLSEDALASHYIGFYYSFRDNRRKVLKVWINFFNKTDGYYPAKLKGLHQMDDDEPSEFAYVGKAREIPGCFILELQEEKNKRPLVLMGYRGHISAKDLKFMRAVLSGISKFGYPFSIELFMVKLTREQRQLKIPELLDSIKGIEHIDYYLQTQRRNFRVPPVVINSTDEIKSKGVFASRARAISGKYRIWSLGYAGHLIQSKFIIFPNYTAELQTIATNDDYQRQTCLLNISLIGDKLCVSSHPGKGISVINFAIFDIDIDTNHRYREGVYCGIGVNGEAEFVAESLTIFRDDSDFIAKRISPEELRELAGDPANKKLLRILKETLFSTRQFARRRKFSNRIEHLMSAIVEKD